MKQIKPSYICIKIKKVVRDKIAEGKITDPQRLGVIATIIYTNKKIRKSDYDKDSNESEQQETTT